MKVLKFGGTSVATAKNFRELQHIINPNQKTVVVLSAMSGITNALVEIIDYAKKGEMVLAKEKLKLVELRHRETAHELLKNAKFLKQALATIDSLFHNWDNALEQISPRIEKELLALGELLSSTLLYCFLNEIGVNSVLLPALDFMRIDKASEPNYPFITNNLKQLVDTCSDFNILVTQGYICRNAQGEVDNLKRGGSDYTAAIIAHALDASEVQIWTDIDGFHNNDPRYVMGTLPIRELSFDEAAELAYFGAKILHPLTIYPCRLKNIPVVLKNTLSPKDPGTIISSNQEDGDIKAVAAKDGITAIRIKSLRMLMAHGFLKKIFDIFDEFETPVDLITTSEVAVTLTIDNTHNISSIVDALKSFSTVDVIPNQSIVCVVGDFVAEKTGIAYRVLSALRDIPIGQISYGGSSHNITFLTDSQYKIPALQALQSILTVKSIADTLSVQTPAYRYNLGLLNQTIDVAKAEASRHSYHLHFAVKANSNPRILETIAKSGLGADCVSGNEVKGALEAGFHPSSIVFAGVGKTDEEIELAIRNDIGCIHVESLEELDVVNRISQALKKRTPIALRLNPNLDAGTHKHITTGMGNNKFGFSSVELNQALKLIPTMGGVRQIGFHFHIGSQITDLDKFAQLARFVNEIYEENSHLNLSYANLGGGLGIDYDQPESNPIPDFKGYFEVFATHLNLPKNISIHFEPGRSIVAQCGELVTKVLYVKEGQERFFAVVDAGMNNLIRPALYQAKHGIYCLNHNGSEKVKYDVVGPICESSDTFVTGVELPKLNRGDLLAIRSVGAYGESMSSKYNLRNPAPTIFALDEVVYG